MSTARKKNLTPAPARKKSGSRRVSVPKGVDQPKEKEFTFHRYDKQGNIAATKVVKESDLAPEECAILAQELWGYFINMPPATQDLFMQAVMREAMAHQAKEEITPGYKREGNIIMPDENPGGGRIIKL